MSWLKENKFVAGVLGVTVLGAGALSYLLLGAKGKYDENSAAFEAQARELNRLETLPAYPDKQNLEVLEAQRVSHLGLIADLQKSLRSAEIPVDPMTPNQFQDQLRAAVTEYTKKVTDPAKFLPKGFYFGFEPYQTTPPNPEAAPLVGRELKVIQLIFQTLLDHQSNVEAVTAFVRDPLPEESNKKVEPPKPTPKRPGDKPATPAPEPLVKAHSLDLTFRAEKGAVHDILNAIAGNKQQFLITRYLALHNTNDRAPLRDAAAPDAVPAAPADPANPTPPTPPTPAPPSDRSTDNTATKNPIIVGEEKVDVTLRLEIVDFAPPAPAATPGAKVNAGK